MEDLSLTFIILNSSSLECVLTFECRLLYMRMHGPSNLSVYFYLFILGEIVYYYISKKNVRALQFIN